MQSIQWNAKRRVFVSPDTGEAWVKTGGGYMEFDDYRDEGGKVWHPSEMPALTEVGIFTNAEISNMAYPE